MNTTWKKRVAGLAVGAAAVVAVPAVASAESGTGEPGVRLQLACARVPNLTIRTDNLITRLESEASVRGSLLWLQDRIDDARDAGRDQLVQVLENRLDVRTAKLTLLHERAELLVEIERICTEHGL